MTKRFIHPYAPVRVFVNGTFDLLHPGHISLLNYAKSLGNYVIVGIDTDDRVREKKGPTRPIYNQTDRGLMLIALESVDEVRYFDSDESLESLVKEIKPDVMVVGSDWKDKSVIGSYWSSDLKFFDRIEKYATSKTVQSIIDRG
tara:strand:+ start:2272 stop:2703 length:432 start_codon:yes stop_codon:yes gene_type:complete